MLVFLCSITFFISLVMFYRKKLRKKIDKIFNEAYRDDL